MHECSSFFFFFFFLQLMLSYIIVAGHTGKGKIFFNCLQGAATVYGPAIFASEALHFLCFLLFTLTAMIDMS